MMVLPKSGSFAAVAGGASPGRCTRSATVSPCCSDVRGGDEDGCGGSKRLPPYSLYLQQPRAERSVLEQRCHFIPLHPQPRWGRDEERRPSHRDKPQFPQKPAGPSPGAGEIRIGPIPPAWLLQQEWGDFPPPPPPPLPPPECGGTRLAQRKHWWGNERKAKPPHERPPHTREPMGCSTFPCRDPNPPLPLASPRGPAPLASASHSWHRSPSTVPCHPLSCQPEHEAQSFALSSRCRQAPGAGKPSPSLAKQLVETQHCQGGTGEKAR